MGDSTLGSTTLQAKYDSNRNWQFSMKLALQIKGRPVGVSIATVSDMRYDKASRKLQAPSIWFGEQGFIKHGVYLNGQKISTYHVVDTGSWRDLSAKTTNGKEGSLVHVTNDITYKAGDNSGCADLLDTSGNAVTSFSTKEGDTLLSCDERASLRLKQGQALVGGGSKLTFSANGGKFKKDVTLTGKTPTITVNGLQGGNASTSLQEFMILDTYVYPSVVLVTGNTTVKGITIQAASQSRTAVIGANASDTSTGTITIEDVSLNQTSSGMLNRGLNIPAPNMKPTVTGTNTITTAGYAGYGIYLDGSNGAVIDGDVILDSAYRGLQISNGSVLSLSPSVLLKDASTTDSIRVDSGNSLTIKSGAQLYPKDDSAYNVCSTDKLLTNTTISAKNSWCP